MERHSYYLFVEPAEKIDIVCSQTLSLSYYSRKNGMKML